MPQMNQIFTGEPGKPNRRKPFHVELFGPYKGNIRAMFWLFLLYLCFWMPKMAQIFTEGSCLPSRRIPFNVKLFGPYRGHVWAMFC